jgi:phosphatidylglycerol---prolipoprotein diacylglyceryl transferase
MHPILIKFADLSLHTYGFMLACGFLLAVVVAMREARRTGQDPNVVMDLAFYILIGALAGSRLFYVLGNWPEFQDNPIEVIKFWRGGLVYYGGLVFAFLIAFWYVRKHALNFPKLADLAAPSIAIGQTLGRLGCFSAGCCYGRATNSFWGCTFTDELSLAPRGIPLHPTQVYESAATFVIFLVLVVMRRRERFQGKIFWYYLLFYSVARFFIEFYRGDPRGWFIPGVLSAAQAIGIPVFILAVFMLLRGKAVKA